MVRQTPNSGGGEVTPSRWIRRPVVGGAPGFAALSQEAESTALGSVSLFSFYLE